MPHSRDHRLATQETSCGNNGKALADDRVWETRRHKTADSGAGPLTEDTTFLHRPPTEGTQPPFPSLSVSFRRN